MMAFLVGDASIDGSLFDFFVNIRQLAQSLGRNCRNVHTDVTELIDLGLLERNDAGTLSTPFDEIIIHAGIRDAA